MEQLPYQESWINKHLRDITNWVEYNFLINPVEQIKFNLNSYHKSEKERALTELEKLGYTCVLENNENSLIVNS